MRRPLMVLLGLGAVLASAACGIKAAPRPPLPPPEPPGTSQPRAQGDLASPPLGTPLSPPDSGTP